MDQCEHIKHALKKQLEATFIHIIDESALHARHYQHPTEGPSHLKMIIVSPRFQGLSRVERHRLVHQFLGPALHEGTLHALTFRTYTPEEYDLTL